jgi:hypothetical protein
MDRRQFFDCIFELVDVWTPTVEEGEYAFFLCDIISKTCYVKHHSHRNEDEDKYVSNLSWKPLRDVCVAATHAPAMHKGKKRQHIKKQHFFDYFWTPYTTDNAFVHFSECAKEKVAKVKASKKTVSPRPRRQVVMEANTSRGPSANTNIPKESKQFDHRKCRRQIQKQKSFQGTMPLLCVNQSDDGDDAPPHTFRVRGQSVVGQTDEAMAILRRRSKRKKSSLFGNQIAAFRKEYLKVIDDIAELPRTKETNDTHNGTANAPPGGPPTISILQLQNDSGTTNAPRRELTTKVLQLQKDANPGSNADTEGGAEKRQIHTAPSQMGLQRRTVGRKNAGDGGGGSACNQLNGSRSPHQHQYKNESHHRGPASPQKMSVTLPTAHFPLQPVGVEWIHQMSRKTDDDNVDVLSISPTPSLLAPSANTPNAFQFLSGTYGERLGTTHQSEGEVLRTEDSLSASTYFSITSDSSPNHRSKKGGPDPILNTVQLGTMPELYSRNEPVSNSHGYFNRSDDSSWRAKKEHLESIITRVQLAKPPAPVPEVHRPLNQQGDTSRSQRPNPGVGTNQNPLNDTIQVASSPIQIRPHSRTGAEGGGPQLSANGKESTMFPAERVYSARTQTAPVGQASVNFKTMDAESSLRTRPHSERMRYGIPITRHSFDRTPSRPLPEKKKRNANPAGFFGKKGRSRGYAGPVGNFDMQVVSQHIAT